MAKRGFKRSGQDDQTFKLRRNQLFGPYGVGAIMPCPGGESLMISGLDAFPVDDMKQVRDRRLAKHIGVKRLLAPPEKGIVPASRFPHWLYCPTCKTMVKCKSNQPSAGKCQNPACKGYGKQDLIPERFIVVCPEGHVDDLPILEWVHRGQVSNPDRHVITRTTKGGTANLGDIVYKCSCGESRSLAGITAKGALSEVGYFCRGERPWLWKREAKGCQCDPEKVMVVQRGGTNVWYPDVFSSIYVPDGKDPKLVGFVEDNFDDLSKADDAGMLELLAGSLARNGGHNADNLLAVYTEMKSGGDPLGVTEGDFRQDEFYTLANASNQQKGVFEGLIMDPRSYSSPEIRSIVKNLTLVTTLRETRALVGFTRLLPDKNEGKSFTKRRTALSLRHLDWTLGIQSTGEGIFLRFKKNVLREWACKPEVINRFALMQRRHDEHCKRHGKDREILNPLYVLIHTLSHILMLSLSKECGYSTASVRERIYCDKYLKDGDEHEDMLGLLIYTASSDSEGSLGGLVRAGRPGRFEAIFANAVSAARWCSSDPICIESKGQGPESCNLAACYSCALVPETSCEAGNKLLDRALLIGTMSDAETGLFNSTAPVDDGETADAPEEEIATVSLLPDFSDGYRMAGEGFENACLQAIDDATTEHEKEFLRSLVSIGDEINLETPYYLVPFASESGEEIESTLAWKESRLALFVGDAADELMELVGRPTYISNGWSLFAATEPLEVAAFASRIREA